MSLWSSALDGLTRVVRDTFPAEVVYAHSAGPVVALTAVFDEAHVVQDVEGDRGVSTTRPVLTVRRADLSLAPRPGDTLSVDGRSWRVAEVQPDGGGMSKLLLTEVVSQAADPDMEHDE
jgi:hypothetical protein